MALNFPKESLSVGQQYTPSDDPSTTYEWDGEGWTNVTPAPATPPVIPETTSESPPASPSNGDKWIKSSTGVRYTYVTEELAWIQL
tara:strand:+ start:1344 stop:1601 length:258 start_codon:yes stop_codon:yes gene_type:complete